VGFQKSATCAEQQVSRCPFVLVDQSAQDRATLDLFVAEVLWVPNWSSTSRDLGVFVYQPIEQVAASQVNLGSRCRGVVVTSVVLLG
jgi:hypothetical protein